MDPYNVSIPPSAPVQQDTDSASADDAKADERRADKARAFKQALNRPGGPTQLAAMAATVSAKPGPGVARKLPGGSDADAGMPLSPAMLRLREEGYPIPQTAAEKATAKEQDAAAAAAADTAQITDEAASSAA